MTQASGKQINTGKHGGRSNGPGNPHKPRLSAVDVLLAPWRFCKWLFFSDLRLKRRNGKLLVVLDAPSSLAKGNDPAATESVSAEQAMHRALKEVLDRHKPTRQVLRHLVAFEGMLGTQGARTWQDAPADLLRRAFDQLEGLVSDWSNADLTALRDKMMLVLVDREKVEMAIHRTARPSDFNVDHRLEVEEVPGSVFSTQVFRELSATLEQIKEKRVG